MELGLAVADQPDVLFREGAADGGPDGFEQRRTVLVSQEPSQLGFIAGHRPQAASRDVQPDAALEEAEDLPEVLVDIAGVNERLDDLRSLGAGNGLHGRGPRSLGLVLLPQFDSGRNDAVLVDEGDMAQRGHLRPVVEKELGDQTTSASVVEVGKTGAADLKVREILPRDVELRGQQTDAQTPNDRRIGLGGLVPPVR
ncbi:hypothetical protein ACWEQC_05875 [Streptomyces shenzhenensis]